MLIAESIWSKNAFPDGRGINTLTGADPIAPYGGAAFHDNKVWIKRGHRCVLRERAERVERNARRVLVTQRGWHRSHHGVFI